MSLYCAQLHVSAVVSALILLLTVDFLECRFNADSANVVHMTVKPQEVVDDEEATKSKALRGDREGTEGTPGCRCIIL